MSRSADAPSVSASTLTSDSETDQEAVPKRSLEAGAGRRKTESNPRLASPLAKLYRRTSAISSTGRPVPRSKPVQPKPSNSNVKEQATAASEGDDKRAADIDALKAELADVRGSQLRMEEMLGKLLAGRGD